MSGRYATEGSQGLYQPGSGDQVLVNKLDITDPAEMDELELELLNKLYESVLLDELPVRTLTVADLQRWHYRWLGNVYDWAGSERSVNMSKGDFHFAAAAQIPRLLASFERDYLARFTPCTGMSRTALVEAIAICHVELILIHPFREGNGRLSRLLADVMAVQAGREPLDYSSWEAGKEDYIKAIHSGLGCDYRAMQYWVDRALSD